MDSVHRVPLSIIGIAVSFGLIMIAESVAIYRFGVTAPDGFVAGLVTSVPVIALLGYAGYWLHTGGLPEDRFRRILGWTIGFLGGFFLLILFILSQTETLSEVYLVGTFRWAGSLGAVIGVAIGIFEAKAIERAREATTVKATEEAIRRERNLLEAAFQAVPNPVVHAAFTEAGPMIINVNDGFEAVFGYDQADIQGQSLDDLLVPETPETGASELNETLEETGYIEAEVRRQTAIGVRSFLLSARTMTVERDGEDRVEGIATYVDLTKQKEREGELVRQNERLEAFTSVVSHDLRNPLNIANGRLELAMEECDSDHLVDIEQAHQRMETLIEDLLELARQGESVGDREPVELAALVERCWANVDTNAATLEHDLTRTIQADESRLQQLFENMFRNAVEHGGATVTVQVGELRDGFYVEDDGPGIPESVRSEVFSLGYTSSDEGTGFGLSIVQEISEAHGWDISATEGSTGGARFEISGAEFV